MEGLFITFLNMSITASWLILAVIAFRFLFKKAPKWMNYILWAIVAVRLICPLSFESVFSLIPSTQTVPQNILYQEVPEIQSGSNVIDKAINPVIADYFAEEKTNEKNTQEKVEQPVVEENRFSLQEVFLVASKIWIVGIVALVIYAVISYFRLGRKVQEAVWLKDNIWQCDNIGTAFILGIIRPHIYIPSSLEDEQMECVIAHEKSHIRCLDHIWKPIGFGLLTLYWFNPFIWVAYILLCKDIEIACDERVVKKMSVEEKKVYSTALLECSLPRYMISACPVAFGEVSVATRVKSVLSYKKPAIWISVIAIIVCLGSTVTFLSSPTKNLGKKLYGYYEMDGYTAPNFTAGINLYWDRTYEISTNRAVTEDPHGTYHVDGDMLILEAGEGEQIAFEIMLDELIYKADLSTPGCLDACWVSEHTVEDGTHFEKDNYFVEGSNYNRVYEPIVRLLDKEEKEWLLEEGRAYDVVIRCYDKNWNYQEVVWEHGNSYSEPEYIEDCVFRTFTLYDVSYWEECDKDGAYVNYPENVKILYAYEWLTSPSLIGVDDQVTIKWSDDNWELVKDSFKKANTYSNNGIKFVKEYGTEYEAKDSTSITWKIDLPKNIAPESMYGSGSFVLVPKEVPKAKSAGILGFQMTYTHESVLGTTKQVTSEMNWEYYMWDVTTEDYKHVLEQTYACDNGPRIQFSFIWRYYLYDESSDSYVVQGYYGVEEEKTVLTSRDGTDRCVFLRTDEGLVYLAAESNASYMKDVADGTLFQVVEAQE